MIDKRKSTLVVKIVSVFLAIAFIGLPLSSLLGGSSSTPNSGKSGQTAGASPSSQVPTGNSGSNTDKAAALVDQGRLFEQQKNYSQAVGYYSDAVGVDPKNNEVKFLLGRAALSSGDASLGRRSLQDYLTADPGGAQAAEAQTLLQSAK